MADLHWELFPVEIGCVFLILFLFALDLILPVHRKVLIGWLSLGGILALLGVLKFQWDQEGFALGGSYRADSYSFLLKAIFLGVTLYVVVMTLEFVTKMERRIGEFFLLILSALLGMLLLASVYDFILLFLAIELVNLSFYVMTAYLRTDDRAIEAGIKYLILSSLASALMLYGVSFIYGHTGSTQFGMVKEYLLQAEKIPVTFLLGILLLLSGLGFKVGAVPFQLWIPDVYEGAPVPVTAFLAAGSKAVGFAVVLRLLGEVFFPLERTWVFLISLLAAMTLLYGNLGAIPQENIKRLLAYSSIGHAGYLLIGIAVADPLGGEALLFYLLAYTVTTVAAFLVVVLCSIQLGSDDLSVYRGLSERSPFLAGGLFIALLSLAGIPPLAGFFGKFLILASAVRSKLIGLALLGAINIAISLYYYLRVVKRMYLEKAKDRTPIPISRVAQLSLAAGVLAIVGIGIFSEPFLSVATRAVSQLH